MSKLTSQRGLDIRHKALFLVGSNHGVVDMKQWILAVVVFFGLIELGMAASLAPEHEMRRLLIVADESIRAERYGTAKDALSKISALKIAPDVRYFYFQGLVEAHEGNAGAAENALVDYVNKAGSEAEYYQSALHMITELGNETSGKPKEPKSDIDWSQVVVSQNDQYLANLKRLYLTNDDTEALEEHINGILAANVFVPGRIRNLNENEGVHYRVSANAKNDIVVQITDYSDPANASHSLNRLGVFGVDPYVRTDCDYSRHACWLRHPIEPQEKWIVIGENQAALQELTKAMTQLIRILQN